jgi:hypothetical protein
MVIKLLSYGGISMFEKETIPLFMGGKFSMPNKPQNVIELLGIFKEWTEEVETWEQNAKISEVHISESVIEVTLEDGIVL